MSKIKKYLLIIGLSFIAFITLWFYLFGFIQSPLSFKSKTSQESLTPSQNLESSLKLIVDFGEGKTIEFQKEISISDKLTAFSLLEEASQNKNFVLVTKKYDFGVFVQSIDNHESSAEKAWIYFVNGKSGQVASDQYELKPGDLVEWKYITPSD